MGVSILIRLLSACLILCLCGEATLGESPKSRFAGLSECKPIEGYRFSSGCEEGVFHPYYNPAQSDNTQKLCAENLSEEALEDINMLFFSGKRAALCYYTGDFYFNVTEDNAYFRITYLSAKTSSLDSIGYFRYDWDLKRPVYMDANNDRRLGIPIYGLLSKIHNECYSSDYSLQIGPFDKGDAIGLYLAFDSFGKSLDYTNRHSKYSISSSTQNRYTHSLTWVYMPSIDRYVIGFDTGIGQSRDYDYNDVVVLLELDSLKMSIPEAVVYEEGRLHSCIEAKHSVDTLRHFKDGYAYTLLENRTETDCLFARTPPPGWDWASYEEESQQLVNQAIQTTWIKYRGATFAFWNSNGTLILVHPNTTVNTSAVKILPGKVEKCIWINCDVVAVIRRPAKEFSNPYMCNPDIKISFVPQLSDRPLSMSFRSVDIKIAAHLEHSYRLPNFELIGPAAKSYQFKLYYLIDMGSNLEPLFDGDCAIHIYPSAYFFEHGVEQISVFLYRDEMDTEILQKIRVGSFRQLKNIVSAAYNQIGHERRKRLDIGTDLLRLANRILLEYFEDPAMCQLVVITDRPWSRTDEDRFIELIRECSVKVTFASTKIEEQPRQKELASMSSSLIDYYIGSKSSPCQFWRGLLVLVKNRLDLASIYVVDKEYEGLFHFGEGMFVVPDSRPKISASLSWMSKYADPSVPTLKTRLAVSGWRGSMIPVTIHYNVPPVGMDMSVKVNTQISGINLVLGDVNRNLVNVRFSKVPASGVLMDPITMEALRDGDVLYNSHISLSTTMSTELLLYNKSNNGEYQLTYSLYDGCLWSEDYVVNITANTPNLRISALDLLYEIPPNTHLSNAVGFNLSSSINDVDPYEPVLVRFTKLPDPLNQGVLYYGMDKVAVSLLKDLTISANDTLYYVPSNRFSLYGLQEGNSKRERVAEFYLEESTAISNVSNIAFLTVQLDMSKESPLLILPYSKVKVSRAAKKVRFEVILEDYEGSTLDLCVSSLEEGNQILEGDDVLATGPLQNDTVLISGLKIIDAETHRLTLNLTWKMHDFNSSQKGVFYLWRSARSSQTDRSTDLALELIVTDCENYLQPEAYNTEISVTYQDRHVVFDIMGTTPESEGFVTVDDYMFSIALMPKSGRLYRYNDYSPLQINTLIAADGPYDVVGSPIQHGAKVSLLYVADPWASDYEYSELQDMIEYSVFNGFAPSERKILNFRIKKARRELKSKNLEVLMLENTIHVQAVPLKIFKFCENGYLNLTFVNSSGLYIGGTEMLKRGSMVRVDSRVEDVAYIQFISRGFYYSYKPTEHPRRAAVVQFQPCCNSLCNDNYAINVYIQHTPHAPTAQDYDKTVVRTEMQKVTLPVMDVDEYDQGKLRVTLIALSMPVRGRLYASNSTLSLIDTSGPTIELNTTTFYYYSDVLHSEDLTLPLDTFIYTATDTTQLTSNQAHLNLYVNFHADEPITSLKRISVDQGSSVILKLASRRYVRSEWSMSKVNVTILSLPHEGKLFSCMDYECSKRTLIESVSYDLVGEHSDGMVMYFAPSGKWGRAFTSFKYRLIDTENAVVSRDNSLLIDIEHINEQPKIEFLNNSFAPAILMRQTEWHDFIWSVTDSDNLPETLYTVLVVNTNNSLNWSFHRCLDEACNESEVSISKKDNDTLVFILPPTKVFNSKCKKFDSLYTLNDNFDECYSLFRYRFYPDPDSIQTTFTSFSMAAGDPVSMSQSHLTSLTSLKINRPPSVWAPEKVISMRTDNSVLIRDNVIYSSTFNKGIMLYDFGADPKCKEKLTMTSDTLGKFELPIEANGCETDTKSMQAAVTVVCIDTLDYMNAWLPRLSFRSSVKTTRVKLSFFLSDLGCSSDIDDDAVYTSDVALTDIIFNSDSGTFSSTTLGIAFISSIFTGVALSVLLVYVFRRYLNPPIQDYFGPIVGRNTSFYIQ